MMRKTNVSDMGPIRINFAPAITAVQRRIEKMEKKLKDKTIANKKSAILLDQWVLQNFQTQGGKVGNWPPFALGGRIVNGSLDTTAKLLQKSGQLRRSFRPWSNNKTAGIGSDLPYSKPHNEGIRRLPQRRMLPENTDEKLMEKIYKVYEKHVKTSIEK